MMIKVKDNWVYIDDDPKPKGRISEGKYITKRIRKEHFYKLGGGYPIQAEIVRWLKEHEINEIVVAETCMDGESIWRTTTNCYIEGEEFNWGHGLQLNVPLDEMEKIK